MSTDLTIKTVQELIKSIKKYDQGLIPSGPLWERVQNEAHLVEDLVKDKEVFLMTEEDLAHRSEHSMVAGEVAAYRRAHKALMDEAAVHFVQGFDEKAKLLRDSGRKIEDFLEVATTSLQQCIDRALRNK